MSLYSGLKTSTCKTYLSKKWYNYIEKSSRNYLSHNLKLISKEQFRKITSQKNAINIYDLEYGNLLGKAREFSLLAVSTYNNPYTQFKTHGFIVNIIIAYTSLFHAIFEKTGINYFYKDNKGNLKIIDGQEKAWKLNKCLKEYWQDRCKAEKANLEFLILLRNKIEHRGLPTLDIIVSGECQAALNNFETLLVNEFGEEYALKTNLAIAMQLSNVSEQSQINAMKEFQT
ncbi:DUF3644 domain-containing protein [Testudinibacter sp. P80/BLE/0925]|uniref:DUF3644 domain-containing protein n=1 Tax=Testudinibacter sp. TW-1 TaxID=3417757 RepID=UPI003D3609D9